MIRQVVPLWSVALLLGCPQVLDDNFELGAAKARDSILDSTADAGVLDQLADASTPAPSRTARVVSSVPADGARGVLPSAQLSLTFDAPMNRASVVKAYASSDLPASEVSFSWSAGDTVLHIQPHAALRSSSGSDPASVSAVRYAFGIGAGAQDAQGRALQPKQVSFSVARAITRVQGVVEDRDLTGNWRSDSVYGLADCERIDTTVCMGDSPAGDAVYHGFMTFDLSGLPTQLIAISSAQLSWTATTIYGTPFTNLGDLEIDHVVFGALGDAAFAAQALPEHQSVSGPVAVGAVLTVDALAAVSADWGVRTRSQYRLAFAQGTDGDGSPDQIVSDWSSAQLALSYWLP
ncbi:MAG TPA: Ig-like domain-containing protein [Polyangiaceae bacterium]|nr:Ig-like domain-containing protein [Polyangiaceae bacterium]